MRSARCTSTSECASSSYGAVASWSRASAGSRLPSATASSSSCAWVRSTAASVRARLGCPRDALRLPRPGRHVHGGGTARRARRRRGRAGAPRVGAGGARRGARRRPDGAMVPLENSVEGSVATTLDELAHGEPLQVVREVLLPVSFACSCGRARRRQTCGSSRRTRTRRRSAVAGCAAPAGRRGRAEPVHRRRGQGGRGGPLRRCGRRTGGGRALRAGRAGRGGAGQRGSGHPLRPGHPARPAAPAHRRRPHRRCSRSSPTTTPARCSRC